MSRWFESYGFAEVADGLLVGAYPLDDDDVQWLEGQAVMHVLNLVEDSEYRPGERTVVQAALAAAGIDEERLRLVDYGHLSAAELETAVQVVLRWLRAGERTYLHCRAGWQRSATVAAGAMAILDGVDVDTALARIQQRKPSAEPLPHQRADLVRWWSQRAGAQSGGGAEEERDSGREGAGVTPPRADGAR